MLKSLFLPQKASELDVGVGGAPAHVCCGSVLGARLFAVSCGGWVSPRDTCGWWGRDSRRRRLSAPWVCSRWLCPHLCADHKKPEGFGDPASAVPGVAEPGGGTAAGRDDESLASQSFLSRCSLTLGKHLQLNPWGQNISLPALLCFAFSSLCWGGSGGSRWEPTLGCNGAGWVRAQDNELPAPRAISSIILKRRSPCVLPALHFLSCLVPAEAD